MYVFSSVMAMPMRLLGMTMEGKRSTSSLRRWKEQRRTSHAIGFTALAFVWAILVMTCFLMRWPRLPPEHHPSAAEQGTHLQDFFISVSASGVGNSRGWGSIRREVQEEVNWVRRKTSNEGHLELSTSGMGSSDQTEDAFKAEEIPKVDKINVFWGPDTSRIKEGQARAQLGVVVSEDSNGGGIVQAKNASFMTDGSVPKAHAACAEVEEMGSAAVGDTKSASLRLRRMIRSYFAEHGADRVRLLPSNLFCERSFVLGKAQEDGFGNNIYKLLTAAGLGMILNRSLIIAEGGSTNPGYLGRNKNRPLRLPFGDYLSYSDQAFSMREVKQLWADHNCSEQYNRPLVLKRDDFDSPAHSTSLCKDWTQWTDPILWFKGTQDTVALQFLLKNLHPNLRSAATMVLGDPSKPDSRPNTFGELMLAVVQPKPEVREAVKWALSRRQDSSNGPQGESPDIALHLRMRHSASKAAPEAAISCITRILDELPVMTHRKPRIVVVSDTASVLAFIKKSNLTRSAEIISFDYEEFLSSVPRSSEFSLRADAFLPPSKRKRDWGPLPRWVAVVDFYLAARARHAVVTGAHHRVGTTFAQLVASLAAAYTLEEEQPTRSYSSFQESLLVQVCVSASAAGSLMSHMLQAISIFPTQEPCRESMGLLFS